MIGIGKWTGKINTMIYSGDVSFSIVDDNGKYGFRFDLPEGVDRVPDYTISNISEKGDMLSAQVEISMLPGKKIDVEMTFDGDTMNGVVKVPFIGKVKLTDFKRFS